MTIFSYWRRLQEQRSLGADVLLTAVTNLGIAAMGFCTGIIAARMLGPHGRGELAAIQTAPGVIATFTMIGMPDALVFYSARHPAQSGRYLGTAVALALTACIPFLIVAWLSMPLLLHAQSAKITSDARWYLLIAPIWAVATMMYHPLRGIGDFHSWNGLRLAVPVAALTVFAIAYMTNHMTPTFVSFGTLVSYAVFFFPCMLITRKRLPGPYIADRSKLGPMLRYGLPCVMTGLPQMLNLRLDQILMAALIRPQQLGLYVVAVAWSGAVSPVLSSIGAILLPSIASAVDHERAVARIGEGVRMTTILAIGLCVVVTIATPIAVPFLFGAQFRASISAAMILIPAAGVLGLNFSLQEGIRGLGYPYAVLRAESLGLVVTAILLAVLLRPLGIIGAAISSIAGYSTVTIFLLKNTGQITKKSIRSLMTPRPGELGRGFSRLATAAREIANTAG